MSFNCPFLVLQRDRSVKRNHLKGNLDVGFSLEAWREAQSEQSCHKKESVFLPLLRIFDVVVKNIFLLCLAGKLPLYLCPAFATQSEL